MGKKSLGWAAALAVLASAAWCPAGTDMMRLPPMKTAPVIDGKLEKGEWDGAGTAFGSLKADGNCLEPRKAVFHLGYDEKNIYFACVSELPPEGVGLLSRAQKRDGAVYLDDAVELILAPPDGKNVYQLIANSKNVLFDTKYPLERGALGRASAWDPKVSVASGFGNGFWTVEIAVPVSEMGQASCADGSEWRAQMCKDWTQPASQACWSRASAFCEPSQMGRLILDKNSVVAKFPGVEGDLAKGNMDCVMEVSNPSSGPRKVKVKMVIDSPAAPATLDEERIIPAGKTESFHLKTADNANSAREFSLSASEGGRELLARSFSWEPTTKAKWDDRSERLMELDFAFYPSYKTVKGRVDMTNIKDKDAIKRAEFFVREKRGGAKASQSVAGRLSGSKYWKAKVEIPDLKEGDYELVAELFKDGRGEPVRFTREFTYKKFPWEGNKLGLDDVVLPPFKPLVVENGGRTVRATMTAYSAKDGLWDKIEAQGENILSAPARLVINDGKIRLEEKSFRQASAPKNMAASESELSGGGVDAKVAHEYDYDGMCKVTLELSAKPGTRIDGGFIELPLRPEVAKLFHSTNNNMRFNPAGFVPEGGGVVWDSRMPKKNKDVFGNFRPYLWVGETYKGLCWFAESDKDWSVDSEKAALEIVRDQRGVAMRINLFSKPFTLDKPRRIVMGFQATPVKPQPQGWRRATAYWKPQGLPETVKIAPLLSIPYFGGSEFGDFWPVNHDYAIVEAMAKDRRGDSKTDAALIESFMSKHFANRNKDKRDNMLKHLRSGLGNTKGADFAIPYLNPRASRMEWPEYSAYMDEWWCSEHRAHSADEYNNHPGRSYQDMMLYYEKKLLDNGLDGIYHDNVRDWHVFNDVTGPAYEMENGVMQPYFDMFEFREMMKRTAVMVHMSGKKFLDDRPLLWGHMTDANIVPFMSFATMSLDWEDKYDSSDFQTRFGEGYILSQTLGTQTGCVPSVLVKITGNETERVSRTFMATILAYDIGIVVPNGGFTMGLLTKIMTEMMKAGYGLKETESYPCWRPQSFVSLDRKDAKMALHMRKDKAILAVSDFGVKDGAVEADLSGLGFGNAKATDLETGKPVPVNGSKLPLEIKKHDFKVVLVEKASN